MQLSAGANPGQRIRVRCAIRIMVGRGEIVSARKGGDDVRLSAGENPGGAVECWCESGSANPGQMRDSHHGGARGNRECKEGR